MKNRLEEIVEILKNNEDKISSMSNKQFLELLNPDIDFTPKPFTKEDEEFFTSLNPQGANNNLIYTI